MVVIWLGIGCLLSAIVMIGPLRWAMGIVAFTIPMAATMVMQLGADPITLPVLTSVAFCLRHATTLVTKAQREIFVALLGRELPLLLLLAYCLVSGVLFPRLFAGQAAVPAQDFTRDGYAILGPHLVSFAQLGYFLVATYLYVAMRQSILRVGVGGLLVGILLQTLAFGGMGFLQAILGLVGVEFPVDWLVTNNIYGLLTTLEERGFVRVTAGFVEASAWGTWAAGALGFCYALFINRLYSWTTAILGGCCAVAMLLSTSGSAYAGLVFMAVIALVLMTLDPSSQRRLRTLLIMVIGGLAFAFVAAAILSAEPGQGFLGDLRYMLEETTLRKQYSSSAIERGQWADAGMKAGFDTYLLGAGYGTVRASGIIPTLFGAIGLPGLILLAFFLFGCLRSLFKHPKTKADAVQFGAAFALAAGFGPLLASGTGLELASMIWIYAAIARTDWVAARAPVMARSPQPSGSAVPGGLAVNRLVS